MLANVIGQERAKQRLSLFYRRFERKGKVPPLAFFGNSGTGKTHLAQAWASEIKADIVYINGTTIKDSLAFRSHFDEARKNMTQRYIVFIDECHMLPRKIQENLLSVLEEPATLCTIAPKDLGMIYIGNGKRQFVSKGDIIREQLPSNLFFIFATTDPSYLNDAMLSRLRQIQLEPYSLDDRISIAKQHIEKNGISSSSIICEALAKRARSIRHLKDELCETWIDVVREYDTSQHISQLAILDDLLDIDEDGANQIDRDYMEYLATHSIAGIDSIASFIGCDKKDLQKRIEPFLLSRQWIMITGKGRRLTEAGCKKVEGWQKNNATP